jgi:hypothetical protein
MNRHRLTLLPLAVLLGGCAHHYGDFTVEYLPDGEHVVVSSKETGRVFVTRYAAGPGEPGKGLAIMVLDPGTGAPILEALDINGDGQWDTVRYVAHSNGKALRVEDNNASGAVRSVEVPK